MVIIGLGAFAPSVFGSLAGAGWQSNGSESVQVRELAQEHFGGNSSAAIQVVVHSDTEQVTDPAVAAVISEVTDILAADSRISEVIAPQPGMSISPDGHTGILIGGGERGRPDEKVKAVDDLKGRVDRGLHGFDRGLPDGSLRAVE